MNWPRKTTCWIKDRILHASIPFTRELLTVRAMLFQTSIEWDRALVGGPTGNGGGLCNGFINTKERGTMIKKKEYEKAIGAIQAAMTQLEPDGNCCAVCGDSGHQAWECHHNPVRMAKIGWDLTIGQCWRCFHCNLIFTDEKAASEHFGSREDQSPKCREGNHV